MPLTDARIEKLRPRTARYETGDGEGLWVITHPSGKRTFAYRTEIDGKSIKVTLGPWSKTAVERHIEDAEGKITLAVPSMGEPLNVRLARRLRDHVRSQLKRGQVPGKSVHPFGEVAVAFVNEHMRKRARWWEGASVLGIRENAKGELELVRGGLAERWRARELNSINKRADLIPLLEEAERIGIPGQKSRPGPSTSRARLMHEVLSKLFNWASRKKAILDASPMTMEAPARATPRSRQLSDREIRLLWSATEDQTSPYNRVARLLLLTGQRRGEIASLQASWINADRTQAVIPKTKNGLPQLIPLAPMARSIMDASPVIGGLLFTINGSTPLLNFNVLVRTLDRAMAAAGLGDKFAELHAIRRTVISRLHALRVPAEVVEAVGNHARRGVHDRHYNMHRYADEKREALEEWEHELQVILAGTKVVKLREAASA
jgi:integrase